MSNRNDFSIGVRATLNTDDIPQQLQKLNAQLVKSTSSVVKVNVGVDKDGNKILSERIRQVSLLKDEYGKLYKHVVDLNKQNGLPIKDTEQIKSITDKVSTLSTEIHKWTNTKGEINTWTTSIDSTGNKITTKVKESVTALGEITTETTKWGQKTIEVNGELKSVYGQIGDAVKQVKEFTTEMTTSTSSRMGEIVDKVNGVEKTYRGLITTTEEVGENGEYLRTVISKYTDELGRTIQKTEKFNKANQQVATTMRKIGEATQPKNTTTSTLINKDGTKIVTEYANGIATLRTETKQYTDTLGRLIQETNVYDEQTHKLISTHREELNNQKERLDKIAQEQQYKKQLTTTTKEVEQSIQREGESYKAVIKTIKEQISDTETLTTTITTYKNKQGELVVETEKVNQAGEHVAQTTRTVTKELDKAGSGAKKTGSGFKDLGDSAERANHGVKNLGWTLGDAISRLSNFYIASLPIRAVQTAITETISTVKEFDSALIEFRKVSDLSGQSLTNYVAKLAEMGEITGSTMQGMVEAATEFRKSSFSDEDSAKLASVAEINDKFQIYSNIYK